MSKDMLLFATLISIFFLAFAWKLFQIARSEHEETKEWPIFPIAMGIILILLSILSIHSALHMN